MPTFCGSAFKNKGVQFFLDSVIDFLTRLEHTVVRYGGNSNEGNVYIYRANIAVKDSEISYGSHVGLYIYDASPAIEGNVITDNANSHGIYHLYGSALIRDNVISRNANGLYAQYSTPTVDANTLTDNSGWGIYHHDYRSAPVITANTITGNLRSARLPLSAVPNVTDDPETNAGNTLVPNRINGLWILGSGLSRDLTLGTQSAADGQTLSSYQIDNTLTVNSGTTLTVAPGVAMKFSDNAELTVNGTLNAVGTPAAPIAFTGIRDDAYGGDLNADGYASVAANGNWRGIGFYNAASEASVLEHAVVRYGGGNGSGDVYIYRSNLRVANALISNVPGIAMVLPSTAYSLFSESLPLTNGVP